MQQQLAGLGYRSAVIAPGLTPGRPGTASRRTVAMPSSWRASTGPEHCRRSVCRPPPKKPRATSAREVLVAAGRVYRETTAWGVKHRAWLKGQQFEGAPLQQTFEACVRALVEAEARLQTLDQPVEERAHPDFYRTSVQDLRCLKGSDTLSALTLPVEAQEFRRFERAPTM